MSMSWQGIAIGLYVLGAGVSAHAGEGETLYNTKACLACHGPGGDAPIAPGYPKLAGQNREYLIQQITDIRDGRRTNGQTALMKPIVQTLTDANIDAIAAYLAALTR